MCFPYLVGIRIMSTHISCDMYLRFALHVQIRLYCVLPYEAKISAQHGIGFILDRCIVYLGLTMPNLQKKRLLIFEIFNIKKSTFFFGTEYICPRSINAWAKKSVFKIDINFNSALLGLTVMLIWCSNPKSANTSFGKYVLENRGQKYITKETRKHKSL